MFNYKAKSEMKSDSELFPKRNAKLDRYTVLDIAAPEGGTALVLTCRDSANGNIVAVKRFKKNALNRKMVDRVFEELKLRIQSKYLVFANHAFEKDGYLHSVLPMIEGKSLAEILEFSNGLTEPEVIQLGISIAEAAGDLHQHGIISADIKPANIMITLQHQVKLIDLTCFERIGKQPEISLGTPSYSAPELEQRRTLSAATDIYSIGVVLLEALKGTEFLTQNGLDIALIKNQYPKLSRIIQRATESDPEGRYADTYCLIADLNCCYSVAGSIPMCCITSGDGKQLLMPPGKCVLGRDDLAPGNPYISTTQFEFNYDGTTVQIRDVARKNQAFLDNILMSNSWLNIRSSSQLEIANIKLMVELK